MTKTNRNGGTKELEEINNDFANANIERIVALAPRTEPLETPINDPTKYEYGGLRITERGVDTSTE